MPGNAKHLFSADLNGLCVPSGSFVSSGPFSFGDRPGLILRATFRLALRQAEGLTERVHATRSIRRLKEFGGNVSRGAEANVIVMRLNKPLRLGAPKGK
jgi:hypothetical protein